MGGNIACIREALERVQLGEDLPAHLRRLGFSQQAFLQEGDVITVGPKQYPFVKFEHGQDFYHTRIVLRDDEDLVSLLVHATAVHVSETLAGQLNPRQRTADAQYDAHLRHYFSTQRDALPALQ